MQINVIYDSSVGAAPAGFKSAISYVVGILDAAIANNVTINIDVGWGEIQGSPVTGNDLGESETAVAPQYSYNTIRNALIANATSSVQQAADATLPATDPTGGGAFDIGTADAKALGLIAGNAPGVDGWVGFSSTVNWSFDPNVQPPANAFDFIATAEHEITEVLGRVSYLGTNGYYSDSFTAMDLFRYSSPGVRELSPGPLHSTGYFSINGGVTNLGTWNDHQSSGDLGDWFSGSGAGGGPGPNGNDAFDGVSNSGVINPLTSSDLTLMNVIGWDPSVPANEVINGETYFAASGQTASNLIVLSGGHLIVGTGGTVSGATISGGSLELESGASAGSAAFVFNGVGGSLQIDGTSMPDNVVTGLVAGDMIDLAGVVFVSNAGVQLLPGNTLSVSEQGVSYKLQLDPNESFSGQLFSTSADSNGGTLVTLTSPAQLVTELYIGYYDRAPDPVGITFWKTALNSGTSLAAIANDFANSSESLAQYPFLATPTSTNTLSFVQQVYENLLNRAPDAAGQAFWAGQIASGAVTPGQFILDVELSVNAQNGTADADTLTNKVTAGLDYATRVGAAGLAYTLASAEAVEAGVTSNPTTVPTVEAITTTFIASGGLNTSIAASEMVQLTGINSAQQATITTHSLM